MPFKFNVGVSNSWRVFWTNVRAGGNRESFLVDVRIGGNGSLLKMLTGLFVINFCVVGSMIMSSADVCIDAGIRSPIGFSFRREINAS